jgi:TrmH family RNA methyltransferase
MERQISKQDPKFQELKQLLKSGKGNLVATDDLSVLRLSKKYDVTIIDFFYSNEIKYHEDTTKDIEFFKSIAKNTYLLSQKTIDSLKRKENSAGLFAIIDLKLKKLDDLKDIDYLVVCDRLEIPGNIGTIYRTCDSAKVGGLILVDPITKANNPNLVSSSRGCNLLIPTVEASYEDTLNFLQNNGYTVFLGEPNLGKDYQKYDYSGKVAIVVGNERFGINPDWYNHKHEKVFIPMYGSNNSLNVSVACSILIYEASMKKFNK